MGKRGVRAGLIGLGLMVGIGGLLGRPLTMVEAQGLSAGSWESWTVEWRGEAHEVRVYRPVGFPAHRPYPVVYLLSGWAMGLGMWERPDLQQAADAAHVLLVALQGEEDGVPSYYSIYSGLPWPGGSAWQASFYDWFFQGVLPWVERRYPVRRDAGGRALVGFSMGGKGAFSLAAHRPDQFAAAVSIGGVLDLTLHHSEALRAVYGPPGANPFRYAADNPVELAPNLKGLSLLILHGAADPEVSPVHSRRMHEILQALGYPHVWEEIPGMGHELSPYAIERAFAVLREAFERPRAVPSSWRYRFAVATVRTVYRMTMIKSDPAAWSEVQMISAEELEIQTDDPLLLITPPVYARGARVRIQVWNRETGALAQQQERPALNGRVRLELPAGHWLIRLQPLRLPPSTPKRMAPMAGMDGIFVRKPGCLEEDVICYMLR
ncbi:alpha/beta hydrolase [Thermoflexus sp.]|uniref:alpha/beta hydrolase n=1 Tax=Thermoflexus sp. TaxID=1969742 RepID=UPI002ADDCECB|nr:alpha/beta hydrolase-fold protein [Thermoflexus sp.]